MRDVDDLDAGAALMCCGAPAADIGEIAVRREIAVITEPIESGMTDKSEIVQNRSCRRPHRIRFRRARGNRGTQQHQAEQTSQER
ncbi:hypothetical protein [Actinophytocola sp.]|uniref:hypothetical protein n=1 Tax=Actinophytocola sp. TaxID=1872138 RepID=UPI00389A99D8